MSRISRTFERLRGSGRKALIGYLTVGYPSIEGTLRAVKTIVGSGCDIVELGIPFSDPLADGTTIQRASFRALQNGVTPPVCLDLAAELRKSVDVPILFMTYYNLIFSFGLAAFCASAARAGVDGLIVPDLPPDESADLAEAAGRNGLDVVYLLAPTSTESRIKLVAESSKGFIYLVSVTGVTGAREAISSEVENFVARVRGEAVQPLCVGFGISSADQAERLCRIADGAIVGSRLIDLLADDDEGQLGRFVSGLRARI